MIYNCIGNMHENHLTIGHALAKKTREYTIWIIGLILIDTTYFHKLSVGAVPTNGTTLKGMSLQA